MNSNETNLPPTTYIQVCHANGFPLHLHEAYLGIYGPKSIRDTSLGRLILRLKNEVRAKKAVVITASGRAVAPGRVCVFRA
jgi:hypothetical protein